MIIGVMSDTHLSRVNGRLRKIVEEHFREADLILHAGDIVSGSVLDYLEAMGVIAVQGNMDHVEVGRLPVKRLVQAGSKKIGLIHGWGSPRGLAEKMRREFNEIDCLVYGHSHHIDNRVVDGVLFFNPGSASWPRSDRPASIGRLHVSDRIFGEIINI